MVFRCLISWKVFLSSEIPWLTMAPRPGDGSRSSRTRTMSGREKQAHQRPTVRKDMRTASAGPLSPNRAGSMVIQTFRAKSSPPPRYPRPYPRDETRSMAGPSDTLLSRAS